jgi:hypothetical protein
MRQVTTLLHLSGGLDSVFVAWDWLRKHPTEILLLHHVKLWHRGEPRQNAEQKAVEAILGQFQLMGLRNFQYHESTFSYGTLPRIAVKDIQIVSLFSGIILRTPKYESVKKLLLSWHLGEVNSTEIDRGFRVKKMLAALDCPHVEFVFPIEFHSRKMMVEELPKLILQHVSSCRKKDKYLKPCGRCKTCKEYIYEGLKPL